MTRKQATMNAPIPPAVTRFERWLRARGYEPNYDPFAPEPDGRVEASALVLEYLIDEPEAAACRGGRTATPWCRDRRTPNETAAYRAAVPCV
jgi:hypothetical protein